MRATPARLSGFAVVTSIRTDGRRSTPSGHRARQATQGGRILSGVPTVMKVLDARQELAKPTLAALVVLAVAGLAWAVMVQHSRSMAGMDGMDVGLGSIESFAATWVVMMAAMMLPSALPVVLEFSRTAERRRGWQVATGVLAGTYLGVWLLFGMVCYAVHRHENALAPPACGRGTGAGSGRRLLGQPNQTGEPGSVPRAMRAAWAASLQPGGAPLSGRALLPQLPWVQRGAHGGHGPSWDVQSLVGGASGHRRPHLQVRATSVVVRLAPDCDSTTAMVPAPVPIGASEMKASGPQTNTGHAKRRATSACTAMRA